MILKKENLLNFFFAGVLLFLTRQVPLADYSFLGNIFLMGVFVVSLIYTNRYSKREYNSIFTFICWSMFLFFYSVIFQQNELTTAIRFYIIFLLLFLSHWVNLSMKVVLKMFFIFIIIQCFVLIAFEIIMNAFFNINNYLPIRFFFQEQGWGDIYTYDGYFYRVQIKGNALIPFAFFLTFLKEFKYKQKRIIQIILIVSSVIAGNFAFLIAIFVFGFIWYLFNDVKKRTFLNRVILIATFSFISVGFISEYIQDTLSRKQDYSLNTRSDQAEVLFSNMESSVISFLLGKGLGNTIDTKTAYRDYTGNIYYELQALYFFNQMGLINFCIFLFLLVALAITKIRDADLLFIYCCYIIYAVTNPYILDTTQIAVIIILLSIKNERAKENRLRTGTLQPQ